MRKIIVGEFMTLDGVIESPGPGDPAFKYQGWVMPYQSEDVMGVLSEHTTRCDAMLLGRKTYQIFEETFAPSSDPFSMFMNNYNKYVVSTTLSQPTWNNSQLIAGDVVAELRQLKQQPGKDIIVNGSHTLVQTLIQNNLVDEFSLIVYPVVLGTGRRLFSDGTHAKLELVEAKTLSKGVVNMVYKPA